MLALTMIYLNIKPETKLMKQFFVTVVVAQLFNFDVLPIGVCGLLGTLSSIFLNAVGLGSIPELIKTKN
jgi:hypothetical protein